MTRLTGKIAVVTAAGSGIGRASASIMAARGAKVLITDIREEAAQAVAAEIIAAGGVAVPMRVDVEKPTEIREMIEFAVSELGGVDIVHNNAAMLDIEFGKRDHSLFTMDAESWDRIMAVNLRSMMLSCQAAILEMIRRGGGSIINTSSMVGLQGDVHLPAYATSKAGVIALTRHVATAFGKQGIRCNAVAPGVIMTPLVEKFLPEELVKTNLENSSTPYLGLPEDVGNAVAFLASEDARFITGQVLAVDGGMTTHLATVNDYRAFFAAAAGEKVQ